MSEDYRGKSLVESGVSIAGSAAGSAVGALVGTIFAGPGPGTVTGAIIGGAAGGAIGETLKKGLEEVVKRVLSCREQIRVGAVINFAAYKIKQRLDAGDKPRTDTFFTVDETDRSDADEIFEGVLLKSKNENQEKKIRFMGNLFANVAFRSDIPITVANFFLSTAEALSYRQLCFIALLHQRGVLNIEALRRRDHPNSDLQILKREEWTLHAPSFGTFGLIDGSKEWEDWLNDLGEKFHDLLGLSEIPQEDVDELSRLISICEASPPPLQYPHDIKRAPESKRKQSLHKDAP